MKLSTNSWHYKFYRAAYPNSSVNPQGFCNYFWKLVLGLVLVPFVWPSYALNKIKFFTDGDTPHGVGAVIHFAIILIFLLVSKSSFIGSESPVTNYFIAILVFVVLVFILVGLALGVIYIDGVLGNVLDRRRQRVKKEKKPSLIAAQIKAIKEKNCPVIEWEEDK